MCFEMLPAFVSQFWVGLLDDSARSTSSPAAVTLCSSLVPRLYPLGTRLAPCRNVEPGDEARFHI